MLDFIIENKEIIIGGGGIGAILGGLVGMIVSRGRDALGLDEATVSELRSMVGSLDRIKDEFSLTRDGFSGIVDLLTPEGADLSPFFAETQGATLSDQSSQTKLEHPSAMDGETGASAGLEMAEKLLDAVMAIPALPKIPDFARDFEMIGDHPVLGAIFSQLNSLDSDSVNTMIGEFKTLVETSLQPGLERAREDGIDFILEPETIESLTKGAGSFMKTIGGMSGILDTVIGRLNDVLDGIDR